MAEALYQSMKDDDRIPAISRGTVVLFPEPVNPKTDMVLANHNLSTDHREAIQLSDKDITKDTLILTMTQKQKQQVTDTYNNAVHVYTLKEFNGEIGDVMDPYGGTLMDYEECYNELSRLTRKTVYRLEE